MGIALRGVLHCLPPLLGALVLTGCQIHDPNPTCERQQVKISTAQLTETTLKRLAQAPATNRARETLAWQYFSTSGCPQLHRQRIRHSRHDNIVCVLPGTSSERIVIGAHYDKLGRGRAVADNWTGVVLASQLIADFRLRERSRTMVIVAFGEEETGMIGASSFVDHTDNDMIKAFINLDTLGVNSLRVDSRSSESLLCLTQSIAREIMPELETMYLASITGDWEPFKKAGIPFVNFHSLDRRALRLLHSRRDTLAIIDPQLLGEAYTLITNLLINLDHRSQKSL